MCCLQISNPSNPSSHSNTFSINHSNWATPLTLVDENIFRPNQNECVGVGVDVRLCCLTGCGVLVPWAGSAAFWPWWPDWVSPVEACWKPLTSALVTEHAVGLHGSFWLLQVASFTLAAFLHIIYRYCKYFSTWSLSWVSRLVILPAPGVDEVRSNLKA